MPAPKDPSSALSLSPRQLRRILTEPEFFQAIFDALPLQVVVKSALAETFGQFLLWNRVAAEWTGWSAGEVLGRTDHDLFPAEDADFYLAKDREVMASGQPLDVPEEGICGRDGRLRHLHTVKTPIFDEAGQPMALLVVSEDVSERRRTLAELDATLRHLRDERNLFHELLDHLPVGVFAKSVRPDNFGVHVFWNRLMKDFHGKDAAEVLGRTVEEVFDPRQAKVFIRQDRDVIERRKELDIPLQCLEIGAGRQRLTHSIKVPLFDEDGSPTAIVGVVEDITERVEREAERAQALDMLRQLNSRVPGAIYRLRVDASGRRAFTYMSERVEEIYRIPAQEFLEDVELAGQCVFPEDRAMVAAAEAEAEASGSILNCEFRIQARGGAMKWVHFSASRQEASDGGSMWSGFITDVTERRRSEEALHESQQRWELALASTEAGVWDWNTRTGEMFFSKRWRSMFACSPDRLPRTPRDLLKWVHPEDRELVRTGTRNLLRRRSDLFRSEYRMRRQTGEYVWIFAHAKAHFDAEGNPTRMIGTLIDITERKRVEAQLVEAKNAAENASRAKGDFLAMMSHEIRTPLNGVLGFAELLAETPLDLHQVEYLQTIRESGSNLLHVLNDILDYSKIESGKLAIDYQPAELRDLVQAAAGTFSAKAQAKGLALHWEVARDVPGTVLIDALRLRQVLTNLISNAVKFTAAGEVRVTVERAGELDGEGLLPLRISVSDNGIGIAAEDIGRLFEPFEQLDISMARRFGGTGLGLSIVHRLIEMMGGKIHATSAPGVGTTFVVELALAEGRSSAGPEIPAAPDLSGGKTLDLLIVDDHPVNRRLARLMLERLGYTPDDAPDGLTAVELAGRKAYDMIFLDIQMPGMDGYEAARRIRHISPGSRLVALTAHAMPSDRQTSADLGMHAHLTKPIRVEELRAALAACSGGAFQGKANP